MCRRSQRWTRSSISDDCHDDTSKRWHRKTICSWERLGFYARANQKGDCLRQERWLGKLQEPSLQCLPQSSIWCVCNWFYVGPHVMQCTAKINVFSNCSFLLFIISWQGLGCCQRAKIYFCAKGPLLWSTKSIKSIWRSFCQNTMQWDSL